MLWAMNSAIDSAVNICTLCCHNDLFLKQEKHGFFTMTKNNFTVTVISSFTHSLPRPAFYTLPERSWSPADGWPLHLPHTSYPPEGLGWWAFLVRRAGTAAHCACTYLPSIGRSPVNMLVIEWYCPDSFSLRNKLSTGNPPSSSFWRD